MHKITAKNMKKLWSVFVSVGDVEEISIFHCYQINTNAPLFTFAYTLLNAYGYHFFYYELTINYFVLSKVTDSYIVFNFGHWAYPHTIVYII